MITIYIYIYTLKFIYLYEHKNREKKKCDQKLIHPFEIFFFLLLKKSAMLM